MAKNTEDTLSIDHLAKNANRPKRLNVSLIAINPVEDPKT